MSPADPLLRAVVLTVAFTVCAATFLLRAALSDDNKQSEKELKAEAQTLLVKSRDLSNIEAAGSPAFALNAKIHYQIGAQVAEGEGQIIWMAPDHYREAYSAPNYFYTEVVRDGYRYFGRTNDEMPFVMYELRTTLEMAMSTLPKGQAKLRQAEAVPSQGHQLAMRTLPTTQASVHQADVLPPGGDALTCITLKAPYLAKLCLDKSADVVTAEYDHRNRSPALNVHYEFSDFTELGVKRFPQKIVFRGGDGHTIEVDVTRLAFLRDAGSDVFKIPVPSTRETWCAEPKADYAAARVVWMNPPTLLDRANEVLRNAGAMLYCVVRPSGRLRSATIIYSSKPVKQKVLDDWIANQRVATLACGSDGIEYQTLISFDFIY